MDRWFPWCIVALLPWLAACGVTAAPAVPSPTPQRGTSVDSGGGGEPKTDYERKRLVARSKREQCLAIGTAIQKAQQQDIILNVSDSRAMLRIARALESSAQRITAACADLDDLRRLRDDYAGNLEEMASALTRASSARGERERKPSLDKFHDREANTGVLIERLNEYCNASVD